MRFSSTKLLIGTNFIYPLRKHFPMALQKHVITGGPCTGKTTTLEALKKKGYNIVEEASRILIDEQNRTGGDLLPWKRLFDFQIKLTELQLMLESKATTGTHFLDRGVIDNLAFCEWGKIKPPKELSDAVKKASYNKIFLLEPLSHFENDSVRTETEEDRVLLTKLIKKHYRAHGYEVISIPSVSVQKRVQLILQKL